MVDHVDDKPPSPWQPTTDKLELAVLGKLLEELGELSSIVARCIIQGWDADEPITGKPNKQALCEEIADVRANIEHVINHLQLDTWFIKNRKDKKYNYVAKWHNMLEEIRKAGS